MFSIDYLRQFRIGPYAIFDFTATFVGIALLAPLLSWLFVKCRIDIPKRSWYFWALPLSIITHLLVGTITPMTKHFLDMEGHYLLKILMIGLVILGFRGVKILKTSQK